MFWSGLYKGLALTHAVARRGGYLARALKPEQRIVLEMHEEALRGALRERATEFLRPPREFQFAITKTAEPGGEMLEENPNACVSKYCKSGYLIAINGILVFELYQLFFKLVRFEKHLGVNLRGPAEARKNKEEEGRMAAVGQSLQTLWAGAIKELGVPGEADSLLVAMTLVQHALEFVLFHEVGHVLMGHVDYFADKTGYGLAEFNKSAPTDDFQQITERHFLELAADRVGEWSTLRLFWSRQEKHDFGPCTMQVHNIWSRSV